MSRNRLDLPKLVHRVKPEHRELAQEIDKLIGHVATALSDFQAADTESVGGEPAETIALATRSPTQNLLAYDAGPVALNKLYDALLADAGLEEGERISASFDIATVLGADVYEIELRFLDGGGAIISTANGDSHQGLSYARVAVEDVTIPAGTVTIRLMADNLPGYVGGVSTRRAMLNRGPYALPFEEPPVRAQRETLDQITDGTLHGKTLLTALTNGEVDLSQPGVVNKVLANIARSGTDATTAAAIVQYIANSGHLAAAMQESGGRAVNLLLAKLIAADPDTLDSLQDGTLYGKLLLSALTSGQVDLSKAGVISKTLQYISDTATRFAAPVENATSDIKLTASGGATLLGNRAIGSGSGAWDSQVYSTEGCEGGAFAQGSPVTTAAMLGLNTDPTADASYLSLDYAFYFAGAGSLEIYESGSGLGSFGTWAAGDTFAVVYDGSRVRYFKNGVALRTVTASAGLRFFLDTSFLGTGAEIKNLRFGPMSSNNAAAVGAGSLIAGISESAGRALNLLLAKGLSADPDTADSIAAGILKRITTLSEADGGGYAKLGLASNGDLVGDIDNDTEVQGGSLFIEDSEDVNFGTTGTPSVKTKTVRIPAAAFHLYNTASSGGGTFGENGAGVEAEGASGVAVGAGVGIMFVPLPIGATITTIRYRYKMREFGSPSPSSLNNHVKVHLRKYDDANALTTLFTVTEQSPTTDTWTTDSGALSEVVSASATYKLVFELRAIYDGVNAQSSDVWLQWVELEYEVPSLSVSV